MTRLRNPHFLMPLLYAASITLPLLNKKYYLQYFSIIYYILSLLFFSYMYEYQVSRHSSTSILSLPSCSHHTNTNTLLPPHLHTTPLIPHPYNYAFQPQCFLPLHRRPLPFDCSSYCPQPHNCPYFLPFPHSLFHILLKSVLGFFPTSPFRHALLEASGQIMRRHPETHKERLSVCGNVHEEL